MTSSWRPAIEGFKYILAVPVGPVLYTLRNAQVHWALSIHYNAITMPSQWARWRLKSPASGLFTQPLIQTQMKENIKLGVTDLCAGNSPVTGEFPAQMASNAGNVSVWWRHHDQTYLLSIKIIFLNLVQIMAYPRTGGMPLSKQLSWGGGGGGGGVSFIKYSYFIHAALLQSKIHRYKEHIYTYSYNSYIKTTISW